MATNVSSKNPVNNIKPINTISKPVNSTIPSATPAPPSSTNTLVDNIALHIKNKLNTKLKYLLIASIPILLLLFYLLYNYNFGARNDAVLSNMNYKKELNHKPLKQCHQQDVKYQLRSFGIQLRIGFVSTSSYDSRLYAYEVSVPLSFSLPAYYGHGFRNCFVLEYKWTKNSTLSLKLSRTNYLDRDEIGSSLDLILGSHKTDATVQYQLTI